MLSYKEWKLYTESLGGAIPLGIRSQHNIGVVGAQEPVEALDFDVELEEAKKCIKNCKKMDGEVEIGPDEEPEDKKPEVAPEAEKPAEDEPKDEPKDEEPEVKDEEPSDEAPEKEDEPVEKEKPTLFQKKKQNKKMKKEETEEWLDGLRNELGDVLKNPKFWGGLKIEDALLAPADPNQGLVSEE